MIIIGGGMTGISTALHLRSPYLLLERAERLGGLCRTEQREGFYFDHTGHWLHLRDPDMQRLAAEVLPGEQMASVARVARVHSHGRLTRYPFQGNLAGLPPEVTSECLLGFVNTLLRRGDRQPPRNFEQYILHHFGEGIARHFMVPYNTKLWGVHPREITSAWCSRFVPIPDLEQVVAGAVGAGPPELGYNIRFSYPRTGGIETFAAALAARLDPARVRTGSEVQALDPRRRTVTVGGQTLGYHAVMSSMPLPDLVRRIDGAPDEVLRAADQLRATPVRYLNVACRTPAPVDYHWVYVPEERLPFYRVGIFSNAVPSMAPAGCSNLYVELASREEPGEEQVRDALAALAEIGAITSAQDVLFADARVIPHAYVVFDEQYEGALGRIFPYLERHRIFSRGRYGAWIYNSMEDSLLAGRQVASVMDALGAQGGSSPAAGPGGQAIS